MKSYFSNHTVINYSGQNVRNLMHSASPARNVLEKATLYNYTLQEGDTPTMIAFDYYGSIDYVWLILYANKIQDIYSQWLKSQTQFEQYLIKKYGSVPASQALIHHYETPSDPSIPDVTVQSYTYLAPSEIGLLSPVYAYDYEDRLNEEKRTIKLFGKSEASKISLELEKLLKA